MDKKALNDIRNATKHANRKINVATKKVEEGNYDKASEYLRETASALNTLADVLDVINSQK